MNGILKGYDFWDEYPEFTSGIGYTRYPVDIPAWVIGIG
jgi:hypothetical protein